jgi:hypothetical protein
LGALRRCPECVADVASGYLKTRRNKVNPIACAGTNRSKLGRRPLRRHS